MNNITTIINKCWDDEEFHLQGDATDEWEGVELLAVIKHGLVAIGADVHLAEKAAVEFMREYRKKRSDAKFREYEISSLHEQLSRYKEWLSESKMWVQNSRQEADSFYQMWLQESRRI